MCRRREFANECFPNLKFGSFFSFFQHEVLLFFFEKRHCHLIIWEIVQYHTRGEGAVKLPPFLFHHTRPPPPQQRMRQMFSPFLLSPRLFFLPLVHSVHFFFAFAFLRGRASVATKTSFFCFSNC